MYEDPTTSTSSNNSATTVQIISTPEDYNKLYGSRDDTNTKPMLKEEIENRNFRNEIISTFNKLKDETGWISMWMFIIAICQIVQCINSFLK